MAATTLEYRDDIAILVLGHNENRFSPEWLHTVDAHLTELESRARGLITIGQGKFFSNGLDLDWLVTNGDRGEWYVEQVQGLLPGLMLTRP